MPNSADEITRSNELRVNAGQGAAVEVFLAALRLGLTSFGGPIAHLGYFRHEFVVRRRWCDDAMFLNITSESSA
jgi:chromate transporter